jgi:hypothetical protein
MYPNAILNAELVKERASESAKQRSYAANRRAPESGQRFSLRIVLQSVLTLFHS